MFGRSGSGSGIAEVLGELLASGGFEFALERAAFASVLHRQFVPGSDRSCEKWMVDYRIAGIEELQLHHFYQAVAWLGEETQSQSLLIADRAAYSFIYTSKLLFTR